MISIEDERVLKFCKRAELEIMKLSMPYRIFALDRMDNFLEIIKAQYTLDQDKNIL